MDQTIPNHPSMHDLETRLAATAGNFLQATSQIARGCHAGVPMLVDVLESMTSCRLEIIVVGKTLQLRLITPINNEPRLVYASTFELLPGTLQ